MIALGESLADRLKPRMTFLFPWTATTSESWVLAGFQDENRGTAVAPPRAIKIVGTGNHVSLSEDRQHLSSFGDVGDFLMVHAKALQYLEGSGYDLTRKFPEAYRVVLSEEYTRDVIIARSMLEESMDRYGFHVGVNVPDMLGVFTRMSVLDELAGNTTPTDAPADGIIYVKRPTDEKPLTWYASRKMAGLPVVRPEATTPSPQAP